MSGLVTTSKEQRDAWLLCERTSRKLFLWCNNRVSRTATVHMITHCSNIMTSLLLKDNNPIVIVTKFSYNTTMIHVVTEVSI